MAGITYFIAAHAKPGPVERLVRRLAGDMREQDRILVHWDARSTPLDKAALGARAPVEFMTRRTVDWGGMAQVDLALAAIDYAVTSYDPDWMIYLSGQDYPIRAPRTIAAELEASRFDAFIDARPVEALRWQLGRARYLYRYPSWAQARVPNGVGAVFAARNAWRTVRPGTPALNVVFDRGLVRLGVRRHPFGPEFQCWKGSQWWTLSSAALRRVLEHSTRDEEYRDHFRRVAFAADEAYFNTILANASDLRVRADDNLRYVRFDAPESGHPAVLTSEDAQRVVLSGKHFARKLDADVDARLFDWLDEQADNETRVPRLARARREA